MIVHRVHQFLFMLPAPFCSTLLSLQLSKNQTKYLQWARKNEIVVKQLLTFFFLFFCLSAFLFFFNSSFRVFCSFFPLISHRIVPNDEQQTNKQKNPIISASIAQSQRGFWGWNGELSSKHLDEHRGGGGGRRSIKFMRGESSKSSRRQRMAAQLTVRKHSLHHTARGGACVGVRGLDVKQQQQKKKHH